MLRISVLFAGLACLFITGCAVVTSEMLANPGLANGPSHGTDVGVIRYLAQGSPSDIQLRQQDANVKMSNACKDKYRVISTGINNKISVSGGGGFYGAGRYRAGGHSGVNATTTDYIYIRFVCIGP